MTYPNLYYCSTPLETRKIETTYYRVEVLYNGVWYVVTEHSCVYKLALKKAKYYCNKYRTQVKIYSVTETVTTDYKKTELETYNPEEK